MQPHALSYKRHLTIETVSSSPSSPMNFPKSRINISPAPSVVSLYTFIEAPPNVKMRYKDAARVIWAECPLDKNAIAAHNKGFLNFVNPFLMKNSSSIRHRGSLKNDLVDQPQSSQVVSNSLSRDFKYKTNNTMVRKSPISLDDDRKSPPPISYHISNVQRNFSDYSDIPSIDEEKIDDLDFSKVIF
uniref:Uncharacterized protein n=1 Tax=Romanomermis culicivorax TaxID=13658 RepID=A0A915KAL3_ROMCU